MSQDKFKVSSIQLVGLMLFAYVFSFVVRMIWVWQFQDTEAFYWNNQLMINTNDGYIFASGAQHILEGLHGDNPRLPEMMEHGIIAITVFLAKFTPFSLESVMLYLPAIISSMVVIPIILIARLYNLTMWGFLSALLGSIAWSYYNRTMVGYYDTDMFSAMAPMFILFFLIKGTMDSNLQSGLYAALAIAIYPFLYDQGLSIVYAMGIIYALYMIFYHRNDIVTYASLILIFVSLFPFPFNAPYDFVIKMIMLILLYIVLKSISIEQKKLMILSGVLFFLFFIFGNVFGLIFTKIMGYLATGTAAEGLRFYGVAQTVREAGQIPFATFANRISGSQVGVLLSLIGYVVLVLKHRSFILGLPLVGIGIFALFGGLRFTVYAVPIAAMSAIYLFFIIGDLFKDKKLKYSFIVFSTAMIIYPNITHIIGYKVPTVLNKSEVQDLVKLSEISDEKDYTIAWWDYGYPIWYYSNTNTLIDGGKHHNDNFIVSQIMQTSSQELAANLSRLAVETYVSSDYKVVANTLFKNKQEDQLDPNLFLSELDDANYKLPKKTRDIYLYLPYRMLRIFPTVMLFGNLDLTTGKAQRKAEFYPSSVRSSKDGTIILANGIIFDAKKGKVTIGQKKASVRSFILAQNTKSGKISLKSQRYSSDGEYAIVYMKSYNQFIVMDTETFNSTFVQMFMLEKYDKNLFELVVSSPYSKIYKLKK
ncbi:MAG: STT3 domain-containing protein [Campylobacterota bacterium]|nr:STT3 domain-containing protein [Campylobacterota bacterium]